MTLHHSWPGLLHERQSIPSFDQLLGEIRRRRKLGQEARPDVEDFPHRLLHLADDQFIVESHEARQPLEAAQVYDGGIDGLAELQCHGVVAVIEEGDDIVGRRKRCVDAIRQDRRSV